MKKTLLLFALPMVLILMGCPSQPSGENNTEVKTEEDIEDLDEVFEEKQEEELEEKLEEETVPYYYDGDVEPGSFVEQPFNINETDFLAVGDGKLLFCDLETRSIMPLEGETGTAVNALFADSDHVYYTVSVDDQLSLKTIDLSEDHPRPQFCADWGLSSFDVIDRMTGGYSDLRLNKNKDKILIFICGEDDDYFSKAKTYDRSSGEVGLIPDESCFEKLLSSIPESVSPDGQLVLSEESSNGVERTFYVSKLDGSDSSLLTILGFEGQEPEWLPDGSLIFIDWYMKFEVVTPDRTVYEVGAYENFLVRPYRSSL